MEGCDDDGKNGRSDDRRKAVMMTGSTDDGARGFGASGRENNSAREFAASGRTTAGKGNRGTERGGKKPGAKKR